MRKFTKLSFLFGILLFIAGCGKNSNNFSKVNIQEQWWNFFQDILEIGNAHEQGKLSDEKLDELVKETIGESTGKKLNITKTESKDSD